MPAAADIFYSDEILNWASKANNKKLPCMNDDEVPAPIVQNSRLCGSRLRLYAWHMPPPHAKFSDIIFDVRACKLGAAAAAITEEYYHNATYDEARIMANFLSDLLDPTFGDLTLQEMQKTIKGGREFYLFRPFSTYKMRHDSIRLAATALLKSCPYKGQ